MKKVTTVSPNRITKLQFNETSLQAYVVGAPNEVVELTAINPKSMLTIEEGRGEGGVREEWEWGRGGGGVREEGRVANFNCRHHYRATNNTGSGWKWNMQLLNTCNDYLLVIDYCKAI